MSLVNEMLKELQNTRAAAYDVKGLTYPTDNKPNVIRYILSIVVVIAVIFFLFYKNKSTKSENNLLTNSSLTTIHNKNTVTKEIEITNISELTSSNNKTTNEDILKETTKEKISISQKIKIEKKPELTSHPAIEERVNQKQSANILPSRISVAKKELLLVIDRWNFFPKEQSVNSLVSLLNSYSDLPTIWQSALSFTKSTDAFLHQQLLTQSLEKFPKNIDFFLTASKYHFDNNNFYQAYQLLNSIDEQRKDKRIFQFLGLILQKQKKHHLAIDSYKKSLVIKPNRGEIHMAIAISFEELKSPKKAISHFVEALKDKKLSELQRNFVKQRLITHRE